MSLMTQGPLNSPIRMQLFDNTGPMSSAVEYLARHTTQVCANRVRDHIREEMSKPKTGRRYRIPGTGVYYTASNPGEYPAVRTSRLAQGLAVFMPESTRVMRGAAGAWPQGGSVLAYIGTAVDYAVYLEGRGTEPGIRPFLRRAAGEIAPELQALAESIFRPQVGLSTSI